jgi:hypothetical protein
MIYSRIKKAPLFTRGFFKTDSLQVLLLQRLDACRKTGELASGGLLVQKALVSAAVNLRLRILQRGCRFSVVASRDGFFNFADRGTRLGDAGGVDVIAASVAADTDFGRLMNSHVCRLLFRIVIFKSRQSGNVCF